MVAYALGFPAHYLGLVGLLVPFFLWMLGNQFYRSHVNAQVSRYLNNPKYDLEIFKLYGGVSWSVPIMWLFLQMVALSFFILPIIDKAYFSDAKPKEIYRIEVQLQ